MYSTTNRVEQTSTFQERAILPAEQNLNKAVEIIENINPNCPDRGEIERAWGWLEASKRSIEILFFQGNITPAEYTGFLQIINEYKRALSDLENSHSSLLVGQLNPNSDTVDFTFNLSSCLREKSLIELKRMYQTAMPIVKQDTINALNFVSRLLNENPSDTFLLEVLSELEYIYSVLNRMDQELSASNSEAEDMINILKELESTVQVLNKLNRMTEQYQRQQRQRQDENRPRGGVGIA